MTTVNTSRILTSARSRFQKQLNTELLAVTDSIRGVLARASGFDGTVRSQNQTQVRQQIGQSVSGFFSQPNGIRAYAEDGVTPLAAYPRLLNTHLAYVQGTVVRQHADFMRQRLQRYPQVMTWLAGGTASVSETFVPNPLLEYEAAHTWVDPNEYQLSDRVWQVGTRTRSKIDQIVLEGLRQGSSAIAIANRVERLLLPSRAPIRTRTPYGRDVSFDAMRLARTELTRAYGQATIAAAQANPYVEGVDWALSASHPRVDICDSLASIGMGGGRLKQAYDKGGVPAYPPHPQCLCTLRPFVGETQPVTREIVTAYEQGQPAPLTVLADGFLLAMLGSVLLSAFEQDELAPN